MRFLLTGAVALMLASPVQAQLGAPNDVGVSFAHVHLNVADIEVHKNLWVEHFGGVVVEKGPLTTVKVPGMFIVLTEREPSAPSEGSAMDHFGFKVPNTADFLAEWRAAGLEVQSEFTGAEGYANAYLIAPDGIKIELQQDVALPFKAMAYHVHFFQDGHIDLMNWYIDVFGAVQRNRGTHENTADVPGINLSFNGSREERAATQNRAIDHIGFEVEDIEAFVEMMKERGVEFQLEPRYIESIELTIAFFVDPSGVRVELTEGLNKY